MFVFVVCLSIWFVYLCSYISVTVSGVLTNLLNIDTIILVCYGWVCGRKLDNHNYHIDSCHIKHIQIACETIIFISSAANSQKLI